jgi:hypothetical protein
MTEIPMHAVVALMEDLPQDNLRKGQVGTIVERWEPGVYEVEFSAPNGEAFAFAALRADQLMELFFRPARAA